MYHKVQFMTIIIYSIYQTSGNELQPRKVTLMRAFKKRYYCESLHVTMKPVIIPVETSLTTLISLLQLIPSIRSVLNLQDSYIILSNLALIVILFPIHACTESVIFFFYASLLRHSMHLKEIPLSIL